MKNQIRSLKLLFLFVSVVLGLNASTRPQQDDISFQIMEGKIAAVENENQMARQQYRVIQQEYAMMSMQFETWAAGLENGGAWVPQLSLAAQSLYMYDQAVKAVVFENLNSAQRKALVDRLVVIKKEFYKTIASANR